MQTHSGPLTSGSRLLGSCRPPGQRRSGRPAPAAAPHLSVVLLQALVVLAQGGQVDEGNHVLEAVDPLLSF